MGEVQKAFTLPADVFEETYEMEMPTKDNDSIVVYCRSGKRSREALNILKGLGYSRWNLLLLFFFVFVIPFQNYHVTHYRAVGLRPL